MRGQRRFFSIASLSDHRQTRDSFYYVRLLKSSDGFQTLKQIHAQIFIFGLHQNPFLAAKLVSRYADQCCCTHSITDARKVFDVLLHRDSVLYNVLIRAYASSGPHSEAISIYSQMLSNATVRPNFYTFPFVLKACAAAAGSQSTGRSIHAHAIRAGAGDDLFVNNSLIAFYAKCSLIQTAERVFDEMRHKDLVTWNSMVSGYARNDYHHEALQLLHQMMPEHALDHATIVSILPSCAALAAVTQGMRVHSYALKSGIGVDAAVGSGLIEMYANCGRLDIACEVFHRIVEKNLVAYSSMMKAFGMHGRATAALEVFREMQEAAIKPDSICFVSVLFACSHAGLVKEGFQIFSMMGAESGVEMCPVHYACMVDLLGRAGKWGEALEFIESVPVEPGRDLLGALLGASRANQNVCLGKEAAQRLIVLDPENAGRYVALAKTYEDLGRWEDVARVRKLMKDRGVRKPLGFSAVEVAGKLHRFGVEDEAHTMSREIFDALEALQRAVDEVL